MENDKSKVIIDEAVFSRIASGDSKAFRELYDLSYRPVFALLLSYTQNYHDAQDLLQETYIKVRAGAHLYEPRGNPMAWVMTIARNVYLSSVRSAKNQKHISWEEVKDSSSSPSYEPEMENRLWLKEMFQLLDQEERAIILLHVQNGFKHKEIAQIMQMPVGTVLTRYHRAIKKMKKQMPL